MDMKDLLGGKGANLAEMTSVLGLPVPAGFTITTDACRAYMAGGWPKGLDAEISKHLTALEKKMGRRLGDPVELRARHGPVDARLGTRPADGADLAAAGGASG